MADAARIVVNTRSIQRVLRNHEAVSRREIARTTDSDVKRAAMLASLNNAMREIEDHEVTPEVLSTPPDRVGSLLQTFLAEKAEEENKPVERTLPAEGIEAKFDDRDWLGWAGSFFTWVGQFRRARWVQPQVRTDSMAADARMALFGDWGTGMYGAPAISRCIGKDQKGFTHVIHVGDVYYSGTTKEMQRRCLDVWPQFPNGTVVSRGCNGNHEMYSGGHGYFDDQLPRFGQSSSCFAFENDHWLVIGLDTAYRDHDLGGDSEDDQDQVGWLTLLLEDPARKNKKLVLLSHHQPYSLLDHQGPKLIQDLRSQLTAGRIHAWYWGHEHRCVVYDPHPDWSLKGRCIGHGGYPYFRDTTKLTGGTLQRHTNGSTWYKLSGRVLADQQKVPGGLVLDGENPFLEDERDKYGPHGYVALEFDGDRLFETYYVAQVGKDTPLEVLARTEV